MRLAEVGPFPITLIASQIEETRADAVLFGSLAQVELAVRCVTRLKLPASGPGRLLRQGRGEGEGGGRAEARAGGGGGGGGGVAAGAGGLGAGLMVADAGGEQNPP